MKSLIFSFFFMLILHCCSAQINVIPAPAKVTIQKGYVLLKGPVGFIYGNFDGSKADDGIEDFKTYLRKNCDIKKIIEGEVHSYGLPTEFFLDKTTINKNKNAYRIEIKDSSILVIGSNLASSYAFQTIRQLITKNKKGELLLPHCIIEDQPRFSYRGMHLDVARHFFTVSQVKKYIDYLAMYKFNTFHWHLTDDQGWRIEIKKYPLLTGIGGCRAQTLVGPYGTNKYDSTKYCGFYTQSQIRDVVKYAASKNINIIPEIELPGHALAALAAYPYLGCTKGPYKTMETWGVSDDVFCAGNDSTYVFMQHVLNEVTQLFPSTYIHIGGDECPHERWKECPVCIARMKAEHLKNENELQGYFVKRIQKYLASRGKKIIGWDEIIDDADIPGATIMSWRGEEGGIKAAKNGNDVIMTPGDYCYFDHSQSANEDSVTFGGYVPLEKVYSYEPIPANLSAADAKHILGAQGNVWTEYITNQRKLEYSVFPRMAALAEVLWTPKEKRDWKSFEERLPSMFNYYKTHHINYSNAYNDLKPSVIAGTENGIAWQLQTKNKKGNIIYRKKGAGDIIYNSPVPIKESGVYEAAITDDKKNIISNIVSQSFLLNKATGKKIALTNEPSPSYAGSGAFTLVNGIQNTKGMSKSSQFLGFNGKDLEAVIDLGEETAINKVSLHVFQQNASWIYLPASVNLFESTDGIHFSGPYPCLPDSKTNASVQYISEKKLSGRFIKIVAKNYGTIPSGQPGADNPAWLFSDEVEVF